MIQKHLSELSSYPALRIGLIKSELTEYNGFLKSAGYSYTLEYIYPDKPNNIQSDSKKKI